MTERAAALGGTLEAAPVETGGWRVRAQLPIAPRAPGTGS
jgi:signal transduction histidine kinase